MTHNQLRNSRGQFVATTVTVLRPSRKGFAKAHRPTRMVNRAKHRHAYHLSDIPRGL